MISIQSTPPVLTEPEALKKRHLEPAEKDEAIERAAKRVCLDPASSSSSSTSTLPKRFAYSSLLSREVPLGVAKQIETIAELLEKEHKLPLTAIRHIVDYATPRFILPPDDTEQIFDIMERLALRA